MKAGVVVPLLVLTTVFGIPVSRRSIPEYFRTSRSRGGLSDLQGDHYGPAMDKRNAGVDAWSICPPQMTDVDCFYAYLRVYARLRKAAEASDRVSMRNIGKRSSLTSLSSESTQGRPGARQMYPCSDDTPPALCYLSVLQSYNRGLADIDTNLSNL